ncbi:hypothetical protein Sfum_4091 [Syntrophobacter fumaroxidans MPOB]|uniref:Uncharacterized protein n=1 Tax=Syntrophobacter fumaroxidans (strain DSM 10017 / MPOB) TaxID=335543 RepID=A0LQQ4_SYNFM|nr:hypothetical protein Sfum_4091 [Syntrophobacter fumaroxidans MPOB]
MFRDLERESVSQGTFDRFDTEMTHPELSAWSGISRQQKPWTEPGLTEVANRPVPLLVPGDRKSAEFRPDPPGRSFPCRAGRPSRFHESASIPHGL